MSCCSRRRWPNSPACRSRASRALVHDRRVAGFRALYDKAGLPASAYPAFREAIAAMREGGFVGEPGGSDAAQAPHGRARADQLRGRGGGEIEPLLTLLRRFAAEAAREEARMFCDELVRDEQSVPHDTGSDAASRRIRRAREREPICDSQSDAGSGARSRSNVGGSANVSLGASGGARMPSRYSGRSRFSCARNSSVTSRSCAVSASANWRRCRRACSCAMMARTASTCWSTSASGMRCHVGRVLDQPAQAVGDRARPAESRRSRPRP